MHIRMGVNIPHSQRFHSSRYGLILTPVRDIFKKHAHCDRHRRHKAFPDTEFAKTTVLFRRIEVPFNRVRQELDVKSPSETRL